MYEIGPDARPANLAPRVEVSGAVEGAGAVEAPVLADGSGRFHVAPAPARRDVGVEPGRLQVLVIDDEVEGGAMIHRSLRRLHDVTVTASSLEALAWLRAGQRYDLIICDLSMPQLSGPELHAALLAEQPAQAARMAFITGGPMTAASTEFVAAMAGRVLWKPFNQATLLALIAAVTTA